MLSAALAHAAQGMAVFPLHNPTKGGGCSCSDPACGTKAGKHPRTANGLKAATTDAAQINRWWTSWPEANIGLLCGLESGIFVLDVDGAEGEHSLRKLIAERGRFRPPILSKRGTADNCTSDILAESSATRLRFAKTSRVWIVAAMDMVTTGIVSNQSKAAAEAEKAAQPNGRPSVENLVELASSRLRVSIRKPSGRWSS